MVNKANAENEKYWDKIGALLLYWARPERQFAAQAVTEAGAADAIILFSPPACLLSPAFCRPKSFL